MFTTNSSLTNNTENPLTQSEVNHNQISNPPFMAPFGRTTLFSSSNNTQHQPFSSIVNGSSPSTSQMLSIQPAFSSLIVPANGVPWKCPEWMSQGVQHGTFMEFNSLHSRLPFKRKAVDDIDSTIKTKQLITEDKMATHLNGLHISLEYTPHNVNNTSATNQNVAFESPSSDTFGLGRILSAHDIEERLKRAQRITVCDELRKLQVDDESILPESILKRYEKPCKALVLWQPPQNLTDLIVPKGDAPEQDAEEDDADDNLDNNNSGAINRNCEASMDVDNY